MTEKTELTEREKLGLEFSELALLSDDKRAELKVVQDKINDLATRMRKLPKK